MSGELWSGVRASWLSVQESVVLIVPRALAVVGLVVVGWLIALILRAVVGWALRRIRLGALFERLGASQVLTFLKGWSPEQVVTSLVFWVTWVTFMLAGLHVLGVPAVEQVVGDLVRLTARLLGAGVVVLLGFGLANFISRLVLLSAVNAGMQHAALLGAVVRWLTIVGAAAMGLEQLSLGGAVVHTAFAILFGALAFGFALAFGLGGRHAARRFLEERFLARPKDGGQGGREHL